MQLMMLLILKDTEYFIYPEMHIDFAGEAPRTFSFRNERKQC